MDKRLTVIGASFVAALLVLNYTEWQTALKIFAVAVAVALVIFIAIKRREWRSAVALFTASVLAAVLFFGIFTQRVYMPAVKYGQGEHTASGAVTEVEKYIEKTKVTLKVRSVDGNEVKTPFKLTAYVYSDIDVAVDYLVIFKGDFYSLEEDDTDPDWKRYNKANSVYLSVYAKEFKVVGETDSHSLAYYTDIARGKLQAIYAKAFGGDTLGALEGITLGEKENMRDYYRIMYQRSGISHAFAVSGMHLTFLALAVSFIMRLFRIRSTPANIITIAIIFAFMALQSFTPSVVRAGIMTTVFLVGKIIGRERTPLGALSLAAIVISLFNPFAVCDLSFQLSFAAVLGIMLCAKPAAEALMEIFDKIKCPKAIGNFISQSIAVTCSAVLFTAPIVIFAFEYVSFLSPLTNLLCIWAIELIFITGYLFLAFSWVPYFSDALAYIIKGVVAYLNFITEWIGKSLPASLYPTKEILIITFALIALVIIIAVLSGKTGKKRRKPSKTKIRKTISVIIAIAIIIAGALTYTEKQATTYSGEDLIYAAVAVGQGDCHVLIKDGKAVVIDCGSQREDAAQILMEYLASVNVTEVEAVIVSHMHDDHVSGVAEIIEYYEVDTLYLPRLYQLSEFGADIDIAASKTQIVQVEDDIVLDDVLDEVSFYLYTDYADEYDFTDEDNYNKSGTVVFVDYGDSEMLFTGDITTVSENKLINDGYNIDVDILKVAHHGSTTSSGEKFLKQVTADIAVISVGDNSYGHPSQKVLDRIDIYIPKTYTNLEGTLQFVTVGDGTYTIVE